MIEEFTYGRGSIPDSMGIEPGAWSGGVDVQQNNLQFPIGSRITSTSIRRKLLVSHLRVAVIGLGMLVVALACMNLLRSNALRLANERGPAVNAALQALGGVQRSVGELSGWVAFGDESFKVRRRGAWTSEIEPAVQELHRATWLSGDLSPGRLRELDAMLAQLRTLEDRVEGLAHASQESAAQESVQALMAKEVVPTGQRLLSFLRGVSVGQIALMKVDAAAVSLISTMGIVLSIALLLGMGGLAWATSARGAADLNRPIERLVRATEELAEGRLTADVPVFEDDEIGRLTMAFNVMRASLVKATESIRQTANQLTDATAQIMAATTQQAKGTREQTAVIRTTVEAVTEIASAAETVAHRANDVSSSVESAAAATAAGRQALDQWMTAMAAIQGRLVEAGNGGGTESAGQNSSMMQLGAHVREVQEAMGRLVGFLKDAEKMAGEAGQAVASHAARLTAAQNAMHRVGSLADQTFERTIQVEHVAQHLKQRSRDLRALLGAYAIYAPPQEVGGDPPAGGA
jgi:methyl-accepting chemotaxis protein